MIKIRNKKFFGLLKGTVCLDIFVKYNHDGKYYWLIGNDVIKSVSEKYYSNIESIDFQNFTYTIPCLLEEYLTVCYGDWKIKDEKWNTFKNDNSII